MKQKNRSGILIGIILLIAIIGVTIIMISSNSETKVETMRIGAILPLTGDGATFGEGMTKGIEIAKQEALSEGKNVELIVEDDATCDAPKDLNAMSKLMNIDSVRAIIGTACSHSTLAIAPIANNNKIILISPSSTVPSLSDAGEFIFRTCPSDNLRAKALSSYIYENLGENLAIIYVNTDSGIAFNNMFKEDFEKLGGTIIAEEPNSREDNDFHTIIAKINRKNPDVILFFEFPKETAIFLRQATEMGVNATLVQGMEAVMEDPQILSLGDMIENITYVNPADAQTEESLKFMNNFNSHYGTEPTIYTAEAYDAAKIIIRCYDKDAEKFKKCILNIKDYPGASGTITFDENGDVRKPLVIKQIKEGKPVIIERFS